MKTLITLIVTILIATQSVISFAFDYRGEFKKRQLIIVLQEEDPTKVAELSKSGDSEALKKYQSNISQYNENVKFAFNRYWSDKEVVYMVQTKADALKDSDLFESFIMSMCIKTVEGVDFFVFNVGTMYTETNKKGEEETKYKTIGFKVDIQSEVPSKPDFYYLIRKLKTFMGYEQPFNRESLEDTLATKTLLIDKGFTSMTEEELKEAYPFPFKLCTTEEIFEKAESNDINCLYFRLGIESRSTNSGTTLLVNFMMVNCGTAQIIARCNVSGIVKVSLNEQSEHSKNVKAEQKALNDYYAGRRSNPIYTGPRGGSFIGEEIVRLYTAKAKLKVTQLKYMSITKKQLKFKRLILY